MILRNLLQATLQRLAFKYYDHGKFFPCAVLLESAKATINSGDGAKKLQFWIKLGRAHVKVWHGRGSTFCLDRAIAAYTEAVTMDGITKEEIAMVNHEIADVHLRRGSYEEAYQVLNKLIKHFPDNTQHTRWCFLLGEALYQMGHRKKAAEALKPLVEKPVAPYSRSDMQMLLGCTLQKDDDEEDDEEEIDVKGDPILSACATAFDKCLSNGDLWQELGDKCSCMHDNIFCCAALLNVLIAKKGQVGYPLCTKIVKMTLENR